MSIVIRPLLALLALSLAIPSLQAQEPDSSRQSHRFSIGTRVPNGGGVYFTIALTPNLRIEPGIHLSFDDADLYYNQNTSQIATSVILGVFSTRTRGERLLYAGARLTVGQTSRTVKDDYVNDKSVMYTGTISPTMGGEYYLTHWLSLGGEGSFPYTFRWNKDLRTYIDGSPDRNSERSRHSFALTARLLMRVHF